MGDVEIVKNEYSDTIDVKISKQSGTVEVRSIAGIHEDTPSEALNGAVMYHLLNTDYWILSPSGGDKYYIGTGSPQYAHVKLRISKETFKKIKNEKADRVV